MKNQPISVELEPSNLVGADEVGKPRTCDVVDLFRARDPGFAVSLLPHGVSGPSME
jgi:hypothetical protein